jgi:hypothetical protein
MSKGFERGIEAESLEALEIALSKFLAKNPLGEDRSRQETESVSLAFQAVLNQIPNPACASAGAVQALLAFLESQRTGKDAIRKTAPR